MSEWIEKEEVLKQIDCWFTTGEYKYSNATHYLNKRISSIKPKESDWVSVKDRLPDEDEAAMVYNAKLDSMYVDYPLYLGEPKLHFDAGVTHWMPLPEQPERKDNANGKDT